MKCASRLHAVAAILIGVAVTVPVEARAFELTGAWASQTDLCKLVFARKGNQIVFTELSDLYGSGFIVDGNRIRGRSVQCTIKSRKQVGDGLELSAACATNIMTSNVNFNVQVLDDNNIARRFPAMEGMTLKYSRCPS
jgi:hypothetical protein